MSAAQPRASVADIIKSGRPIAIDGELADLLAAIGRLVRRRTIEWQPMATAPVDGSEVLVSNGASMWLAIWNGRSWDDGESRHNLGPMTHWLPLPALPGKPQVLGGDVQVGGLVLQEGGR